MNLATKTCLPAMIAAFLTAPAAHAEMTFLNTQLLSLNNSRITIGNTEQTKTDNAIRNWNSTPEAGFDDAWSADQATEYSLDGFFTRSASSTILNTDSTGFFYTTTIESEMSDTSLGFQGDSLSVASLSAFMMFDVDTEVDVYLRIEYDQPLDGFRFGSIEIYGLENAPINGIYIDSSVSGNGSIEFGFRALARADQLINFLANGQTSAYSESSQSDVQSGAFTITMEVRAVPAPGGLMVLGGLGVVAVRRRR